MVSLSPNTSTDPSGEDDVMPLVKQTNASTAESLSKSSTHQLAPYPSLSDLPPVGQSLWPLIWQRDPGYLFKKKAYCILVVACLAFLLRPSLLLNLFPELDVDWDDRHGVDNVVRLMVVSLRLSEESVVITLLFSFGCFAALIFLDVMFNMRKTKLEDTQQSKADTYPWPTSWNTDNYLCYHDMFAEPTRYGRFLRRPGNTITNVFYFLTALLALNSSLFSSEPNYYWATDALFGGLLLILAVHSVIWHASNAPWSQYPDLWSMDSSIAYLVLRYLCMAGAVFAAQKGSDRETASWWAAKILLLVYLGVIYGFGKMYYGLFRTNWLIGTCPFGIRPRIMGTANVFGKGHEDIYVGTVCAFTGLPFVYLAVPAVLQIGLYEAVGSRIAVNGAFRTLVVGWTYRMWERFMLDGNPVMNYFLSLPAGPVKTVGCAVVSCTGQHHIWTGMTLLAGYTHGRSMETEGWP